ncbi:MAG: AAA family ATPase [Marinilabiliaceae bacterium]|nr:AAA family ATPase [Bacteroidales bacterium]
MRERLVVKSFGPIKELDIEFRKVTIFIGDQGMGKSCVAKLFSMFKWLEKVLTQKRYPENYFVSHNRFITKLCAYNRMESFVGPDSYIKYEGDAYNFEFESNKEFKISAKGKEVEGISKIMYVPAERAILSVAENKPRLLKELPDSSETFYDEFVNAKKSFQDGFALPFDGLRFEYDSLNDAGWIRGENYRVRLVSASSGIQSSLPMCIVTEYLSKKIASREEVKMSKEEKDRLERRVTEIIQNDSYSNTIKDIMIRQLSASSVFDSLINVIEEPELSLFPKSQMRVLYSLIASNASSKKNMLVLTTHSPYTLAIINTMIMGGKARARAEAESNEVMMEETNKVLPAEYQLSSDEVAVYRLDNDSDAYCKTVMNPKTGLISKNELDAASDDIMKVFNSLYRSYASTFRR